MTFNLLCRLRREQRGAVAVLFAVLFPVVVGILAIGIETGIWYDIKRHDQAIADIAAYSGALEIAAHLNDTNTAATCASGWSSCLAAKNDAFNNSFDVSASANSGSALTVGSSACGSSTCQTVTVVLKHQQPPLMVSSILGGGTFPIVNQATAQVISQDGCMSSVATSGTTLMVKGGAPTVDLPDCTITSNSTSADSIKLKGGTNVTAYTVYTAGGISNASGLHLTVPPTTNGNPLTDPYASVSVPTMPTSLPSSVTTFPTLAAAPNAPSLPAYGSQPAAPTSQTGTGCSATTTFSVGTHCYTSASTITISGGPFTLAGAVYSFSGPVTIAAGSTVNFVNNSAFSLKAAGDLTINGTVNFTGANSSVYITNGNLIANSASTISFSGGAGSAFGFKTATNGKTYSLAGTTLFGNGNYAFYGGSGANLGLNGCTVFTPGTATLYVVNGNLSTSGGSGVYFNPNGAACSSSYTAGASTYALQVQSGGTYTFGSAASDPATFGPATYGFKNAAVTLNGTTTFQPGTTNFYVQSNNLTTAANSTVTFCGASAIGSCANSATSAYALNANSYTFAGTTRFGASTGANKGYGLYGGGLTINSGSNVGFLAPVNFYLNSGSMAVDGCVAVQGGSSTTSTIKVNSGGLTEGSTGSMTFNPNGSTCGINYSSGTSDQYNISTNTGTTFGGAATLNSATYFFMGNGGGVTVSGGTSGSPITFAGGTYSVQNGDFAVSSTGHMSMSAGTLCAPSGTPTGTCLYLASGGFSNAGATTFGAGTIYFWDGSNGFSTTATASGALTFTGGSSSSYYFFSPSASGNTTLNIGANANVVFNPATYYIVNGGTNDALVIGSNATLTCPNCVVGGAGDTFILTGTGSGTTLTNNIGTINISNNITTSLSAAGTGTYAGLLFFQDRNAALGTINRNSGHCSNNCNEFDGGSAMDLTGVIYLPRGVVDFSGGHSSANCLVLIDAGTTFQSNVSLRASGCQAAGAQTLAIRSVALTQ